MVHSRLMKVRRLPLGLAVPVLLVGLVAVLATLQYRWLGQVSEAEREQLRRSLNQRAREFADEFDVEISRAYATLQLRQNEVAARDWTAFASAVDKWNTTAKFPQTVRGIYLAESAGDQLTLRAYDHGTRSFQDQPGTDWPERLEPVRRQLTATREPGGPPLPGPELMRFETARETPGRIFTIAMATLNIEVPALIVPVSSATMDRGPAPGAVGSSAPARPSAHDIGVASRGTFVWLQQKNAHVIVELNGDYLRQTVLPALADKHFPEPGPDRYRLAVLSPDGSTVFSGGLAGTSALEPGNADVVVPLMTFRIDLAWGLMPGGATNTMVRRTPAPEGESRGSGSPTTFETRMSVVGVQSDKGSTTIAAPSGQVRLARQGWRLVLQHGAGSLDAAVARARQRNLALSFGILAILSAGIALVVINARRSEQLAARQMEFVATVSHELRTPLTVIRSAAQNLSAGVVADPGQTRRYGALIEGEGQRLTDMVEQVLDYAGLTGNRALRLTQVTDAGALVNEVMASCQPVVEQAGCAAEVSVDEGLMVMADQEALRRAVQNLVTNALKHASDGRWIGVTAQTGGPNGLAEVVIAVSDRGRGIPAQELPHIFEAFYRGRHAIDQQVRGNGLGLNLVKRIVEAHGGRVSVRSAAGEGSTFTIKLPAAPAEADVASATSPESVR
jgi:signal transduction histidine kinase